MEVTGVTRREAIRVEQKAVVLYAVRHHVLAIQEFTVSAGLLRKAVPNKMDHLIQCHTLLLQEKAAGRTADLPEETLQVIRLLQVHRHRHQAVVEGRRHQAAGQLAVEAHVVVVQTNNYVVTLLLNEAL